MKLTDLKRSIARLEELDKIQIALINGDSYDITTVTPAIRDCLVAACMQHRTVLTEVLQAQGVVIDVSV